MLDLIKEIESSLKNNNLRCALGMALTLPDICGKVEYPGKGSEKRYVGWCEKYLFNQGFNSHIPFTKSIPAEQQRVISPEVCYKLRCAYLHSGNLELNQRKGDNFPEFRLIITNPEDEGVYSGSADNNKHITIDIRHLTKAICNAAKDYHEKSKSKEDFQSKHIHITDMAREAEKAIDFFKRKNEIDARENSYLDYNQLSEGAKKLLEDIRNRSVDVTHLIEKGLEIKQDDADLMIHLCELVKGGFVMTKEEI